MIFQFTTRNKCYLGVLILSIFLFFAFKAPLPLWLEFYRFIFRENIAGVSVVIIYPGGGGKKFQIGRYSESGIIDANTKFPLASLSKPLTAAAIYRLKKSGHISLDDDITKVMPSFSWNEESMRGVVTAKKLLQHTSGMSAAGQNDPLFMSEHGEVGCASALLQESSRVGWLAGRRIVYSNVGYCLLGQVIKFKTDKGYQDAVVELLEIPSTSKMTISYKLDDKNTYFSRYDPSFYQSISPVGGWFSSAEDYVNVLNDLNYSGDSSKYLEEADLNMNDAAVIYAVGWRVYDKNKKLLTHFGYLDGVFSVAMLRVDGGAAVALFSGAPRDPNQAFEEIASLFERSLK